MIKIEISNCSSERKLMTRTKLITEPKALRRRAESRWENEGGAMIAPEIASCDPVFTKTTVSVGKLQSLRTRIKRFWLGARKHRYEAAGFLARHSQPVMISGPDKPSLPKPIDRVRTHRGLASLSIRPGSDPTHMTMQGSMSTHGKVWPCFVRTQSIQI